MNIRQAFLEAVNKAGEARGTEFQCDPEDPGSSTNSACIGKYYGYLAMAPMLDAPGGGPQC